MLVTVKNLARPLTILLALFAVSASAKPQIPAVGDQAPTSLPEISSRADFDKLARIYHEGTPYSLPHVMFVIDRRSSDKVYYINTNLFRFHKDFLLAEYLVPRGADVHKPIYIDADRRFIVGTVAWQQTIEKFTWELWEGDLATRELIKTADSAINRSFFSPLGFKPNSPEQDTASAQIGIRRILRDEIERNREYLALNTGRAVGRIHIIEKLDDTVEIGDNEIVILRELPISLPPVRGIIVAKPSSPLSHVNVLARGWGIPNVYIKDADKLFRDKDTFVWEFEANLSDYKFNPVDAEKLRRDFVSPGQQIPPVDLSAIKLTALGGMRKKDSVRFGSKAANLGEMMNARIPGIIIPDGFSIPFFWYDEFMKRNGLDKRIEAMIQEYDFVHNPRYRRQKLDELRSAIQKSDFDPGLRGAIFRKWRNQLNYRPVFVRSSSNAEDLPNFSGAGLYSSVANVRKQNDLIEAVKKVWASLWKFEAYEARVRNYVSQTDVYMSALIQTGIDMQKGGVMITGDPYNRERNDAVFISAVCGHNSRVVDNRGIPEQILFDNGDGSIIVRTLSDQINSLRFAAGGDLKPVKDRCADARGRVVTDSQVKNLARAATKIEEVFGNGPQDIEWGILFGRIYVVQSRPFIDTIKPFADKRDGKNTGP